MAETESAAVVLASDNPTTTAEISMKRKTEDSDTGDAKKPKTEEV